MDKCLICERIDLIKQNKNPYFVKELETGFVVLGDFQYYFGYTLFLSKIHVAELDELKFDFMKKFLEEMAQVASAVRLAFKPAKINYELLGNSDPHLHWHIVPRYESEVRFREPIWVVDKSIRCAESFKITFDQLKEMKERLLKFL